MLRSGLGSSLVAKSTPGTRYRETAEAQIPNPGQNQGAPGSLSRVQVEEPLERAVSPGSSRAIAVKPLIEGVLPVDKVGAAGLPFLQSFGGAAGQAAAPGRVVAPRPYVPPAAPQAPANPGGGGNNGGGNNNGGGGNPAPQAQAPSVALRSQAAAPRPASRPTVTNLGGRKIVQEPTQLRSRRAFA